MKTSIFQTKTLTTLLLTLVSSLALSTELKSVKLGESSSLINLRKSSSFKISITPLSNTPVRIQELGAITVIDIDGETACTLSSEFNEKNKMQSKKDLKIVDINSSFSTTINNPVSFIQYGTSNLYNFLYGFFEYTEFKATLESESEDGKLTLFCLSKKYNKLPNYRTFKDAFNKMGIDLDLTYSATTK